MNQVAAVEQPETKSGEPDDVVRRWLREIGLADKDPAMTRWRERARGILQKYREEGRSEDGARRFAMLWSNTETLKPAVYARAPKAEIGRRFKDADPVGRIASEMLERSTNIVIDCNDLDSTLRQVRDDFLLIARGQGWVRYKPVMRQVQPPDGEPFEEIEYERVCVDYVHWDDFGHTVARTWPEVRAVWRRVYLTRDELVERFGKEAAAGVSLDHTPSGSGDRNGDADPALKKATVYEIWDKVDRKVYFVPKNGQQPLAVQDPPIDFENFFPCPRPAYGTTTNDSTAPIPDFIYWQDQAEEINDLTQRIAMLTDSLKLVGFYAQGPDGDGGAAIQRALKPETQSEMIPVDSWAAWAEKGGVRGLIEWLPVDMVVKVMTGCFETRKQLVQDVYEITGISDILRGSTDPNETLGAQQIKANWGSLRVRDRQSELARFARDVVRLVAEVIAEVFQPQTLVAMTGIKLPTKAEQQQAQATIAQQQAMQQQPGGTALPPQMPPAAMGGGGMAPPAASPMAPPQPPQVPPQIQEMLSSPTIEDVMALLRSGAAREFRIDIETDSTVQPDEDAEKARRTEFLTAVGGFLQQVGPMVQMMPQTAPMFAEMLMFGVRGFRAGRGLEDVIERTMQQVVEAAQQPKPAAPDPVAMAKAENDKGRLQLDTAEAQAKARLEQGWQSLEADKIAQQGTHHAVDATLAQRQHATDTQIQRAGLVQQAAARPPQPGPGMVQ